MDEHMEVRSDEARRRLRNLLDAVEDGVHVTLLRYNKPAAVIVPVEWYEQAKVQVRRGDVA
jgi:prevent-host-death family protein